MDTYREFKKEIEAVSDDIDTFLYILDKKMNTNEKVGDVIDRYTDMVDRLKNALNKLKEEKGEIRIADIDYEGEFRINN